MSFMPYNYGRITISNRCFYFYSRRGCLNETIIVKNRFCSFAVSSVFVHNGRGGGRLWSWSSRDALAGSSRAFSGTVNLMTHTF